MDIEQQPYQIILDTETNGLPYTQCGQFYSLQNLDMFKDARMLQIACLQVNKDQIIQMHNSYVNPNFAVKYDGFPRYYHQYYQLNGEKIEKVLEQFMPLLQKAQQIYIHNANFDLCVLANEIYLTYGLSNEADKKQKYDYYMQILQECTQKAICTVTKKLYFGQKPFCSLQELFVKMTGRTYVDVHDAKYDVDILHQCLVKCKFVLY